MRPAAYILVTRNTSVLSTDRLLSFMIAAVVLACVVCFVVIVMMRHVFPDHSDKTGAAAIIASEPSSACGHALRVKLGVFNCYFLCFF